ncbi:unnamed protein product [Oppiella nova]|uniref:DRBM domain-containing protein n=1 Tax=Oppiella nova TaxID=334625 RepID=A0A7R9L9E1_9ACAR|nr:unnamed protein product [Oppiella nova]CAG2160726.1 unnamed protein product [Oppiella nova]
MDESMAMSDTKDQVINASMSPSQSPVDQIEAMVDNCVNHCSNNEVSVSNSNETPITSDIKLEDNEDISSDEDMPPEEEEDEDDPIMRFQSDNEDISSDEDMPPEEEEDEDDDEEDDYKEDSMDSDSDIPVDDIDNMLEEGMDAYQRPAVNSGSNESMSRKRKFDEMKLKLNAPHEERKKIVLKKRDQDYFEVLPEGWLEVTHFSGMPIYLHKQTRVCTTTKPYYLGPGSARKHEIPISAIPCLQYKKELEKDKEEEERNKELKTDTNSSECNALLAKVETVSENKKEKSLDYMSVRNYCQNLFEFQTITIRKFKTWADRRKHTQLRKLQQRPSLPDGTKLITCPLPKTPNNGESTAGRNYRKEFVMNPAGKSFVCILHEFVQHAERVQPKYTFQELENASQPYSATVIINGMEYGKGFGSSKKQAKSEADPRVSDLCAKAGQHSPYQILVECLRRNWGMGDTDIETDVRLVKHQKNEFIMKVGKHTASVNCRNKREGKQRAAQAILKLLHPQITSWGKDLEKGREGGTWLAMNTSGKIANLLNILQPKDEICFNKKSRGFLVVDYLEGNDSPQTYLDQISKESSDYNPFRMVAIHVKPKAIETFVFSNSIQKATQLNSGVYIFGNNKIDEKFWPKHRIGRQKFEEIVNKYNKTSKSELIEAIFGLLSDTTKYPLDDQMRSQGRGKAIESLEKMNAIHVVIPEAS